MGRSKETFNKKEVRKKQEKKRKDKAARKLARKENGKTADQDMIAYVDEFGNIVSEPPEEGKKKDIKLEDIEVSIPKNREPNPEDLIKTGVVSFFNEQKGYGFIRDLETKQNVFVHINDVKSEIKEGNKVSFQLGNGPKGPIALDVDIVK